MPRSTLLYSNLIHDLSKDAIATSCIKLFFVEMKEIKIFRVNTIERSRVFSLQRDAENPEEKILDLVTCT